MKVLVTGSSGMLGKNVRDAFLTNKPDMEVTYVNRNDLDLLSKSETESYLKSSGVNAVIHAAAIVGGGPWKKRDPVRFLYENMQMDSNVIWGSLQAGVENVAYISSSSIYPWNAQIPIAEDALFHGELEGVNENYALAKIFGMKLCSSISKQYAVAYKSFVLPNLFGIHDHFDPERSHLVPAVILRTARAMASLSEKIELWGNANDSRELLFASDFSEWLVENLPRLNDFPDYMNMGSGAEITILDFYKSVFEVAGFKGELVYEGSGDKNPSRRLLDSSIARSFGWNPTTSIEEGLSLVYSDYNSRDI